MKKTLVLVSMTFAMALSASAQVLLGDPLAGSEWRPAEIAGETIGEETEAFVRFESDGNISGNGGCNLFKGRYLTNGDWILFGPMASTMMACEDRISSIELQFLRAVDNTRQFSRLGTGLELRDAEGQVLLHLRQKDAD